MTTTLPEWISMAIYIITRVLRVYKRQTVYWRHREVKVHQDAVVCLRSGDRIQAVTFCRTCGGDVGGDAALRGRYSFFLVYCSLGLLN
jgi:hypothetical protein